MAMLSVPHVRGQPSARDRGDNGGDDQQPERDGRNKRHGEETEPGAAFRYLGDDIQRVRDRTEGRGHGTERDHEREQRSPRKRSLGVRAWRFHELVPKRLLGSRRHQGGDQVQQVLDEAARVDRVQHPQKRKQPREKRKDQAERDVRCEPADLMPLGRLPGIAAQGENRVATEHSREPLVAEGDSCHASCSSRPSPLRETTWSVTRLCLSRPGRAVSPT